MSFQPRSRLKAPDLGCFSLFSLDPAQHCPDALGCPQGFSEAPGPVAFFGKNEKKSNRRKMLEKSQAKSIMVVHGGHSTHFLTKIESRSQRSNPRGRAKRSSIRKINTELNRFPRVFSRWLSSISLVKP